MEVVDTEETLPPATTVRLVLPDPSDQVSQSALFRTSAFTGRGDAWLADPTTRPCSRGDCRGGGSKLIPLRQLSMDDIQDLPEELDPNAKPPKLMPAEDSLPQPQLLTYYRLDIFDRQGWTPPATWADLLTWAQAVNGTVDADDDGRPDWPLCLDTRLACKSGFLLLAMTASVVQPSTAYGTFFEPVTMYPAVGSKAFVEALSLFSRLAHYSAPMSPNATSADYCRSYEPGLFAGSCLLTLSFDQLSAAIPSAAGGTGPGRGVVPPGALGVAPLPGSEVILDRQKNTLELCGADSCPNAVAAKCYAEAGLSATRQCLVNRAPLVVNASYDLTVSEDMRWDLNGTLDRRITQLGTKASEATARWGRAMHQTVMAKMLLAEAPAGTGIAVANWTSTEPLVQLGCSAAEAARFLEAYWGSLLGNDPRDSQTPGPQRNVVQELRIRGSSYFTNIYAKAAAWVIHGKISPGTAADWALAQTQDLLELVAANKSRLAFKYCQDIGWTGDEGAPRSAPKDGGLSAGQLTAAIVAPVVAVCLAVLAVVVLVILMRRNKWLSSYRTVGPPGPGLGTTLILTDIQNSTVLWETLPADTMDAAIRCHHDVLRGLLVIHQGYESATEGDAFILAFHTAEDAARYAVVAQEKLLAAPWPEEMLSHPDCEVVWMAPQRFDPTACLSYVNRELVNIITRTANPNGAGSPGAGHGLLRGATSVQQIADAKRPSASGAAAPPAASPLAAESSRWVSRLCCGRGGRRSGGGSSGREGGGDVDSGSGGRGGGGARRSSSGGGGGGATSPGSMRSGETTSNKMDLITRITRANSFRPKSRSRLTQSAPSETLGMGVSSNGVAGGGADQAPLRHPLDHLSPLMKCPSDIRSYMIENEADAELGLQQSPKTAAPGAVQVPAGLRACDSNGVPLPPEAAATAAVAVAGPAGGGAVNGDGQATQVVSGSNLQRTSALSERSYMDLPAVGSAPSPISSSLMHLSGSMAVSTLTEALKHGWKKTVSPVKPGPAGVAAGGAGGKPGAEAGSAGSAGAGPAAGGAAGVEDQEELLGPVLAFRGMRVRMGLHTGADLSEVSLNKATGRTQYSGTFMTVAKAVCDSAHGGQVVLSPATFKRLPPGGLAKSAFLLHMGEHMLSEGVSGPEAMYQLLPYSLGCRLALFAPLRTVEYLSLGLPDAPVGRVTVAFMYVIGAQTLLAWNPTVAGDALTIFQDTVSEQLSGTDGYVVELVDGLCLAAFRSAADALLWSLRCGRLLLSAPWSDELLEHELCEEVSLLLHSDWGHPPQPPELTSSAPAMSGSALKTYSSMGIPGGMGGLALHGQGQGPNPRCYTLPRASAIRHKMLMRGLRLKVGMDTGFAADSINATTGRMAYRGRPMNRAARIASKALAGQVHCSAAVWSAAVDRLAVLTRAGGEDEVTASSLGLQSLKGVMEKIEVMSVSYKGSALSAEEAAAVAKRAPRTSQGSSGMSSNPAVLSGVGSGLSLAPASSVPATGLTAGGSLGGPTSHASLVTSPSTGAAAWTGGAARGNGYMRQNTGGDLVQRPLTADRLSAGRQFGPRPSKVASPAVLSLPFEAGSVGTGVGERDDGPEGESEDNAGVGSGAGSGAGARPGSKAFECLGGGGGSEVSGTGNTIFRLQTSLDDMPSGVATHNLRMTGPVESPATSSPRAPLSSSIAAAAPAAAAGSGGVAAVGRSPFVLTSAAVLSSADSLPIVPGPMAATAAAAAAAARSEHVVLHLNPLHDPDGNAALGDGGSAGNRPGGGTGEEGAAELSSGRTTGVPPPPPQQQQQRMPRPSLADAAPPSPIRFFPDSSTAAMAMPVPHGAHGDAAVAPDQSDGGDQTLSFPTSPGAARGAALDALGRNSRNVGETRSPAGETSPVLFHRPGASPRPGARGAPAGADLRIGSGRSDPHTSATDGSCSRPGASTSDSGAPTPGSPGSPLSGSCIGGGRGGSQTDDDGLQRVITLTRRIDGGSCIGLLPLPPPALSPRQSLTTSGSVQADQPDAGRGARRSGGGKAGAPAAAAEMVISVERSEGSAAAAP